MNRSGFWSTSSRRLLFGCMMALLLPTASALGASEAGDEEEEYEEEETAVFHPWEPGTLEIDGSGLHALLELPEEPRVFETSEEFVEFAIDKLNAEMVYAEETGELIGVEGFVSTVDTLLAVDPETLEVIEIEDPIAAYVGGRFGYFFIGDQKICVDPSGDGCEEQLVEEEEMGWASTQAASGNASLASTYRVSGSSSYINLWFYKYAGAKTTQRSGGWSKTYKLCWKWGFIPWVCSKTKGWNELGVQATFTDSRGRHLPIYPFQSVRRNVSSVSTGYWGFFLPIAPACVWEPQLCVVKGVKGSHWGHGPEGSHSVSSCTRTGC